MTTIAPNTAPAALKQLFDRWVAILSGAGLAPEAELTALFPLLEKIGKVVKGEGRIPFVIVVQTPALTLAKRMKKVVLDGMAGMSCLANRRVADFDNIPEGHYLAVDVENGRAMRNVKPSVCLQRFKKENRFGGTVFEGISVVTYKPDILRHHSIDLPGSYFYKDFLVPYLEESGVPLLDVHWGGLARPRCGSLSCGSRLALGS